MKMSFEQNISTENEFPSSKTEQVRRFLSEKYLHLKDTFTETIDSLKIPSAETAESCPDNDELLASRRRFLKSLAAGAIVAAAPKELFADTNTDKELLYKPGRCDTSEDIERNGCIQIQHGDGTVSYELPEDNLDTEPTPNTPDNSNLYTETSERIHTPAYEEERAQRAFGKSIELDAEMREKIARDLDNISQPENIPHFSEWERRAQKASERLNSLPNARQIEIAFKVFSKKHGIPENLAKGIAVVESGMDPNALNTRTGAGGLMGLKPIAAREGGYNVGDPLTKDFAKIKNILDKKNNGQDIAQIIEALSPDEKTTLMRIEKMLQPQLNIGSGVKYLAFALQTFEGQDDQLRKAIAGYNAGVYAIKKSLSSNRHLYERVLAEYVNPVLASARTLEKNQ